MKSEIQGGYVYILSNVHRTVFYVGFTTDILKRTREHKFRMRKGFTSRYNCTELLYYQSYFDMDEAQGVERKIKKWKRDWKLNLIREQNPMMIDLAKDWYGS